MEVQEHLARQRPPSNSATAHERSMQTAVTGAAAAAANLWSGLPSVPAGKVLVRFESLTTDCYIRIGPTSTTATTSSNGTLVSVASAGHPTFFLDPLVHVFVDVIAPAGAGVLKWWVVSPVIDRKDQ